MSTPLLVQALAALSAPALAGAGLLGARLRRSAATAAEREAALQGTVAELRRERDELQRTASCDPLTGVWNYRHLQITLDKEIERARRAAAADEKRPLALLMLEIAGFDAVVAEHGRSRAGAVLRDLAQRLAVEIRRSDTLGRYGGEEFLVLLPDTGAEGAAQVAERLVWTVRRHRLLDWSASGAEPRPAGPAEAPAARGNGLTAAVGIAVLPRDGSHAALLLRAADRALAEARQAGGDCWRGAPVETVPAAGPAPVPAVQPGRRSDGPTGAVGKAGSLSACTGTEATLTSVGHARTAAATAAARDGV
ncbi:GGDEF domain-containing protein [Kitasatospora sp. DSM 101779]|uniref:GGDEF domain-containing protein n=1 Tax=Kitasatospora sp. DSM 101779 TaxID=2853165 RepID=UPI0021DAA969|nr:GGDEF domain-containing protein [Kitasatospora sp. DSM 101779]MCU7823209.1 GGDEF domain-containing protein [Kitasatospora sp. DSM 101779]